MAGGGIMGFVGMIGTDATGRGVGIGTPMGLATLGTPAPTVGGGGGGTGILPGGGGGTGLLSRAAIGGGGGGMGDSSAI